jgi:hypothetical protein
MWETYVNKIIYKYKIKIWDLRSRTYTRLTDFSCPVTKVIFLMDPTAQLLTPSFHHSDENDLAS